MINFQHLQLGDILTLHYGKALPAHKRKNGNIPVYSSAGLTGYHDEALVQSEGLIIGRKGTIGKVYKSKKPFFTIDTAYYIKPDEKYDLDFIYYLLQTMGLDELNEDSAVPGLNRETAYSQTILFPDIAEQKSIASILSSLDDKIDLLHRQNKTLEALSETLFRQWFVEEVSDEYEEKPLDEIAEYLNGVACQKFPPLNEVEKIPVLKIKELRSGFSGDCDWVTDKIASEYIVEAGDIIFSWSGSLIVKIWDGKKCALNQHLFKVTSKKFPKWFVYYWTKHHLAKFTEIAENKATTMGHIKRSDLSSSMVFVPDDGLLKNMNNKMSPIFDKLVLNNSKIHLLETLRDTLLPKLMSGEILLQNIGEK